MSNKGIEMKALFNRMYWPTQDISYASCRSIAVLLADPESRAEMTEFLLQCLTEQPTEYRDAVALLPLVYAIQVLKVGKNELTSPGILLSRMSRPSYLSNIYLKVLGARDWVITTEQACFLKIDNKCSFNREEFIDTLKRSAIPLVLPHRLGYLSQLSGIDCLQHMYCEYHYLLDTLEEYDDSRPDIVSTYVDNYVPLITRGSDLYMSAYLRTLSWLSYRTSLPEDAMENAAALVSPATLRFWKVDPTEKPEWWFWSDQANGSLDALTEDGIQTLWHGDHGLLGANPILRASGRIANNPNPIDLDIAAVFTPNPESLSINDLKEVSGCLDNITPLSLTQSSDSQTLKKSWFREQLSADESRKFSSASIKVGIIPYGIWHWAMMDRGLWIPSHWFVTSDLSAEYESQQVSFKCGSTRIATLAVWNSDLGDRCPIIRDSNEQITKHVTPSNGACLLTDSSELERVKRQTQLCPCWLCRARSYSPTSSGTGYEVTDLFALIYGEDRTIFRLLR